MLSFVGPLINIPYSYCLVSASRKRVEVAEKAKGPQLFRTTSAAAIAETDQSEARGPVAL